MKVLICIVLTALIKIAYSDDYKSEVLNEKIDGIIDSIRENEKLVSKFDPYRFPTIENGDTKISNGKAYGLSKFKRNGDCIKKYNNDTYKFNCKLGVDIIKLEMAYNVENIAGFIGVNGDMKAETRDFEVTIDISGNDNKATLDHFKVSQLKDFVATYYSINWYAEAFVSKATFTSKINENKNKIKDTIEKNGGKMIEDNIQIIVSTIGLKPGGK